MGNIRNHPLLFPVHLFLFLLHGGQTVHQLGKAVHGRLELHRDVRAFHLKVLLPPVGGHGLVQGQDGFFNIADQQDDGHHRSSRHHRHRRQPQLVDAIDRCLIVFRIDQRRDQDHGPVLPLIRLIDILSHTGIGVIEALYQVQLRLRQRLLIREQIAFHNLAVRIQHTAGHQLGGTGIPLLLNQVNIIEGFPLRVGLFIYRVGAVPIILVDQLRILRPDIFRNLPAGGIDRPPLPVKHDKAALPGMAERDLGKLLCLQLLLVFQQLVHGRECIAQPFVKEVVEYVVHQKQKQRIKQKVPGTGKNQAFPDFKALCIQFCIPTPSPF